MAVSGRMGERGRLKGSLGGVGGDSACKHRVLFILFKSFLDFLFWVRWGSFKLLLVGGGRRGSQVRGYS